MATRSPVERYTPVAITLHWLIALLILGDFALSQSFSRFNPGDALYFAPAYALHMAVGLCILLLTAVRIAWRMTHRRPALPDMGLLLRLLARAAHLLLYVFMLVAPLSGWLVLSLRHQRTSVFGLFSWAWPLPVIAAMPRSERVRWHDALLPAHVWISYVGMALVGVHVAAALYHHFGRRDAVLGRMLPARRGGAAARTLSTAS